MDEVTVGLSTLIQSMSKMESTKEKVYPLTHTNALGVSAALLFVDFERDDIKHCYV